MNITIVKTNHFLVQVGDQWILNKGDDFKLISQCNFNGRSFLCESDTYSPTSDIKVAKNEIEQGIIKTLQNAGLQEVINFIYEY